MNSLNLQSRKAWLCGSALLALLIVLVAWFLAIGPKRSDASDLRGQVANAQVQNAQLQAQNSILVRKAQHLGVYQTKLAAALAALPSQSELSQFSQSLVDGARRTGVDLTSITVGSPAAVTPVTEATSEATESDTTSTDNSDTTAAPVPETTNSATGPLSTAFTLQASGTTAQDLSFLTAIRSGSRSALVSSAQFADGGNSVAMTAQVEVFSAPIPAAQLSQLHKLLKTAK